MRTRGFTLIELMVSMALFGLIAAGAMSLVLSGARTQSRSARVDVAQTSLRSAIDFITRDVVGASAGAKTGLLTLANGTTVNAVVLTHNGDGPNGADSLELYTVDGSTAAQLTSAVGAGGNSLPITYEQSSSGATGQFLSVLPYPAYVQVSDLSSGSIVKLNAVTSTALTLGENLPAGYAANGWVLPSRHVTYAISNTLFGAAATGNAQMLTMDVNGSGAQPLAEGVEDLQVAYGFDNDGNGVITDDNGATAGGDEWLYNAAGETLGTWSIANLRTIRVTLVVKGTSVEGGQQNLPARPAAEDHAGGTVDGFIRRVLRTEIAVRNFNL